MRRILIADIKSNNIEGKSPGHYFTVAQNYVDMFSEKCESVIVGGPIYKKFQNSLLLKYDTDPNDNALKQKRKILANSFELFALADKDIVVIQSNALVTLYVALLFSGKENNLFLIQYNCLSINSFFKRLLFKQIKKKICGILCPTDDIGRAYGLPYCVVPDYCVTKKDIEHCNESAIDKKYDFGMVGLITHDKGIIEAAKQLAGKDVSVIIAGRADTPEIEKELLSIVSSCNNVALDLGYISDEKYDEYIRKSRFCILNYTDAYSSHSSGVVYDVLYRATPIIGRMCETLRFISENQLGYIYDSIEQFDFESILNEENEIKLRNNIIMYLDKQLAVSDKIYGFLQDKCKY